MTQALEQLVQTIQSVQGALLDAWVVVDLKAGIVAFNRTFFALFPRRLARALKNTPLGDVLELRFNAGPLDLVAQCLERQGPVRYDEVEAHIPEAEPLNLIVSATPLVADKPLGAFIVLRDVTDEAKIQVKYKQMLQEEADAKAHLEDILRRRTEELLLANDKLNATQMELMKFRKGLLFS